MSNPPPPPSPKGAFPFLRLPGELRNKIYAYISPESTGKLLRYQLCCPDGPRAIQPGCPNHRVKTLHDIDHRPSTVFPLRDVCKALRLETEHIAIAESTVEISCPPSQRPQDGDWIPTLNHTLNFPAQWLRRVVFVSPYNGMKLDDFDLDGLRRELHPIAKLCDRLPKASVKYVFDFCSTWKRGEGAGFEEASAVLKAGVLTTWLVSGQDIYDRFFPDHPTWRTRIVGAQGLPTIASTENTALMEADNLRVTLFPEWELHMDDKDSDWFAGEMLWGWFIADDSLADLWHTTDVSVTLEQDLHEWRDNGIST